MSVEQVVAALRDVPTFEVLPDEALRDLAASGEEVALKTGEVLFRAGDTADAGHVILTGRVELFTEPGGRRKRLCEVLPGALLGETALLIPATRPATARALEPVRLLRLPRTAFLRVLEDFPEAAVALRSLFAERVAATVSALDAVRVERLEVPRTSRG